MNKNDKYVVGVFKPEYIFPSCPDCEYLHPEGLCVSSDALLFKIMEPDIFTFEDFFDAVSYATKIYAEFNSKSVVIERNNSKLRLILSMGDKCQN